MTTVQWTIYYDGVKTVLDFFFFLYYYFCLMSSSRFNPDLMEKAGNSFLANILYVIIFIY